MKNVKKTEKSSNTYVYMYRLTWTAIIILFFVAPSLYGVSVYGSSELININTASATTLQELHGVGPTISGRIVEYRENNDGFQTIEEIQNVKGIGSGTFEDIKDRITVENESSNDETDGSNNSSSQDESDEDTASDDTSDQNEEQNDDEQIEHSGSGGKSVELKEDTLVLSLSHTPQVVMENSPVVFHAHGTINGERSHSAQYEWNTGDGHRAFGEQYTHVYHHPGDYTVVLRASTLEQERRAEMVVRVREPSVSIHSIERSPDGSITLANDIDKKLDISGWTLHSSGHVFTVPDMTYLISGGEITFDAESINVPVGVDGVTLRTPKGEFVDRYIHIPSDDHDAESVASTHHASSGSTPQQVHSTHNNDTSMDNLEYPDVSGQIQRTDEIDTTEPSHVTDARVAITNHVQDANKTGSTIWMWLLGLAGVMGAGMVGVGVIGPDTMDNAEDVLTNGQNDTVSVSQSSEEYTIHDISSSYE